MTGHEVIKEVNGKKIILFEFTRYHASELTWIYFFGGINLILVSTIVGLYCKAITISGAVFFSLFLLTMYGLFFTFPFENRPGGRIYRYYCVRVKDTYSDDIDIPITDAQEDQKEICKAAKTLEQKILIEDKERMATKAKLETLAKGCK